MKTIMAMYMGDVPKVGEPNKPFFMGGLEIVEAPIQAEKGTIDISREPILAENVLTTSGGFFVTPKFEIGIMPGTSFVVVSIEDHVADPLVAGEEGYMVRVISYMQYEKVLREAANKADVRAAEVGDFLESAYLNYFAIDPEKLGAKDLTQIVAKATSIKSTDPREGLVFEINRMLPAKQIERVLATIAYIQEITKQLKIISYSITIYLHTVDGKGEPCTATVYAEETKLNSDQSSD